MYCAPGVTRVHLYKSVAHFHVSVPGPEEFTFADTFDDLSNMSVASNLLVMLSDNFRARLILSSKKINNSSVPNGNTTTYSKPCSSFPTEP